MFKKFQPSTDVSGQVSVKSSVQRNIRASILSQWKINPETFEQIWPKKEPLTLVKCREHISIYTLHGEPLFFQHFDGPFFPTLRLLHKYPSILPMVRVDRGAIRFLLAGAHMMCKEHAAGIGLTKLGTEEIRKVNKGVGVETVTYLGDDLWKIQQL
ncbi:hypothetical protein C8T65DRAFT_705135 [Cerioporus squamosus]|nr:hypothetical protein C8T65DRAFT_705135 [Cerioporus squamosus]